jgi:hypothetical protein
MEPDARNRARRQAAYERAAQTHRRAVEAEERAAELSDEMAQPELAARHRAASRRKSELAQADSDEARALVLAAP